MADNSNEIKLVILEEKLPLLEEYNQDLTKIRAELEVKYNKESVNNDIC